MYAFIYKIGENMDLSNLLNLLNNQGFESIISLFSTLFSQPQQTKPNSSQNGLENNYFKLPSYDYSTQQQNSAEPNINLGEIIKLILPLLSSKQKKSEPTISSDFKSEILSLPRVK